MDHPDTLDTMQTLGLLYEEQRRWSEAEALLREVVKRQESVSGKKHIDAIYAGKKLKLLGITE